MPIFINFFSFWILMTWTLHRGDPIGAVLTIITFLIMHGFCEELVDNSTGLS